MWKPREFSVTVFFLFVISSRQTPLKDLPAFALVCFFCFSFVFIILYFTSDSEFRRSVSSLPERKTQPHCAWILFVTKTYIHICMPFWAAAKHSSFNCECMSWTLINVVKWILYSIFGVYLPDAESVAARDQSGIEIFFFNVYKLRLVSFYSLYI